MKIEDDCVYHPYGIIKLDLELLLLFVHMTVVDHYGHHGGMLTLPWGHAYWFMFFWNVQWFFHSTTVTARFKWPEKSYENMIPVHKRTQENSFFTRIVNVPTVKEYGQRRKQRQTKKTSQRKSLHTTQEPTGL